MKGVIYKYTFPDGKVYIGQTRRPIEARHKEHIDKHLGPLCTGFWEAYQKYGEVQPEIICEIEESDVDILVEELNRYESVYIQEYKAIDPKFGYNRMKYGRVPAVKKRALDEEFSRIWEPIGTELYTTLEGIKTKVDQCEGSIDEKESELLKTLNLLDYVSPQSESQLPFFSDLSKNTNDDIFWFQEALDFEVFCYQEEIWDSIRDYLSENAEEIIARYYDAKTIQQIDDAGNVVKEYTSFLEILHEFNIPRADNVKNVLKGRQKTAYGFHWKYKNAK